MAEKGVDDLCRVDNGTDIETRDTESEQNLCVNETAGSPEISKAFTESNLAMEREKVACVRRQQSGYCLNSEH